MAKFAFAVAIVSMGFVVALHLDREGLRQEIDGQRESLGALEVEFARTHRRLEALDRALPPAPLLVHPAADEGAGEAAASGPALAGRAATGADAEERIARLERELAETRQRLDEARSPVSLTRAHPFLDSSKSHLLDVDAAEKALSLSPRQRAEVEAAVEDTRRALKALRSTPNDEGLTWEEAEAKMLKVSGESSDSGAVFSFDHRPLERLRHSRVPGRNETYAEAEQRIRQEGKSRARGALDARQAEIWDGAQTDWLFRVGGGPRMRAPMFMVGDLQVLRAPEVGR
jgi:chromosome segregation ATPase